MQEIKNVKVLVCLFVYNAANTIEGVLESLIQQSFKDFVIILIDNNSEDDTLKIVNGYLKTMVFGGISLPDLFNFKGETTKSTLLEQLERLVDILKNRISIPNLELIRFVTQNEVLEFDDIKNWVLNKTRGAL